ncbi:membrane-spanning 4-domains subfamily A member 6A [Prionailurus viverrinus]|uniref:membrane-spanning 4-domains subfamily A member 6A n=1 Tax=Prionailurus viverrinus TaxID=61388 RepID=UPI001FF4B4E1|nr:membrane-spanning 4-domains subfamily A member 6A [Prionailurus viverrinus]
MLSRSMTNEAVAVLTPNGISFPQTEEPKPTNQRQYNLKKQLKAEVKVLGAIQILCGVMVLSLGIILVSVPSSPSFTPVFSTLLKSAYPFMGGLCFVISGTLSVIMEKKSTKPLVQSSVVANILSSLCALVGFILLSVTLDAVDPAFRKCTFNKEQRKPEWTTFSYFINPYMDKQCITAKTTLTVRDMIMGKRYLQMRLAVVDINPHLVEPAHGNSVCDADLHGAGVLPGCALCRDLVETGSL